MDELEFYCIATKEKLRTKNYTVAKRHGTLVATTIYKGHKCVRLIKKGGEQVEQKKGFFGKIFGGDED